MNGEAALTARAIALAQNKKLGIGPDIAAAMAVGPDGTDAEYRAALTAALGAQEKPKPGNLAFLRLAANAGEIVPWTGEEEPETEEAEADDQSTNGPPADMVEPAPTSKLRRDPHTGVLDLRPRLHSIDFSTKTVFTPPSWLVKGVLPQQGIGLLFGESGAGKTFLAIHAALCVATGAPFFGNRTKKGGVLYVAAEGGSSVVPRINAAAGDMPEGAAPIRVVTEAPNLSRDGKPMALTATIDDAAEDFKQVGSRLALVVLDTWHAAMGGGDENSAADAGAALTPIREAAERHGVLVLVLHHPGKDTERGARGSTALPAAADAIVSLTVPGHGGSVGKPSDAIRVASVTKLRDGETGAGFSYRLPIVQLGLDEDGDPWTTCLVEPCDGPVVPKGKRSVYDGAFDGAVLAVTIDGRADAEMARLEFNAVCRSNRADMTDGALRKAWSRALEKAQGEGRVSLNEENAIILAS
ncbi:MAG: AAA family ATPase [Novosphingobium sp.]